MSRLDEINSFLQYYANLYAQNPNLQVTEGTLYSGLMSYDVGNSFRQDISGYFGSWEDAFRGSKLRVYEDARQKGFIQFRNRKNNPEENFYDYKLYVNLPPEHLDEGVRKIFGFMAKHNMETYSKVAAITRADGVVLRIPDQKDMIALVNFINKDRMLSKYSKKTNPFLQRYGVVGAAYDKLESFNSTVSKVLCEYFMEKRRTNTLNRVSIEDFSRYVTNFYNTVFTNQDAMVRYFDQYEIKKYESRHSSKADQILNYKQMIELLSISVQRDMPMQEYVQIVNGYSDRRQEYVEMDKIHRIYTGQDKKKQETVAPENPVNDQSVTKYNLDNYIRLAIKKYGVGNTPNYLQSYLKGNEVAITREGNYRNIFKSSITPDIILEITNYNIEEYVAQLYINDNRYKYDLFINACMATAQKYNDSQLYAAVSEALKGEFKYITNDGYNSYRGKLRSACNPLDIKNICEALCLHNGYAPKMQTLVSNFTYIIENEVEAKKAKSA